jgi:3,4-dihydroxy 2-butanone 4-phosphate synthase/GTP cyclohydrolase II
MIQNNLKKVAQTILPTTYGEFTVHAYSAPNRDYLAMVMGDISNAELPILCRVHSSCVTGDLLGSLRCDCGDQLKLSLEKISEEKRGVFLYLEQEGRGIGLVNKMRAYELQDEGLDTVEANLALGFKIDQRDYRIACLILSELEIKKIKLMTNNPEKHSALSEFGIEVTEVIPLVIEPNLHNQNYLKTKKDKLGHSL